MKKIIVVLLAFLFIPIISSCQAQAERTEYNIDMEYFNGSIQYTETVTFSAQTDNYNTAYFNCYPLAYNEGQKISPVQDGNYARCDILEVSSNEKMLDYKIEDSLIKVKLAKKYNKNEKVTAKLKINVKIPNGGYRMAKTGKTVNLGNVFTTLAVYDNNYIKCDYGVIGDPFVSDVANYKISITVPSTYVVAGGGVPTSTDVGDSKTRYSYEQNSVRDFAFVISENFQIKQQKWGNKSINYYFYDDINADKTLDTARLALEYFSKAFGEYPYQVFNVCQTGFINGGMEYPLLVYLSDSLEYDNYIYALVHEIAHQWWYGIVGNNQIEESYLDESLAEYSAYMFFAENSGYGINADELVKSASRAVETCERSIFEVNDNFVPAVKKPLSEFKSEYEYVNMVYSKGFIMFKSLENLVGRDNIKNKLKNYFETNKFKIAKTENFLYAFDNDRPFLNSYLDGKTRVFA